MKKYVFLLILLITIYLLTINNKIEKDKNETNEKTVQKEEKKIYVSLTLDDSVENLELEDYIVGVVACEMPASFNHEALKAMAVASRTYALNREIDSLINITLADQCYNNIDEMKKKWQNNFDKYYEIISKAVGETKYEYISYKGKPIKAFYFSNSNGYTEDVKNVFNEEHEYLKSVSSPWDLNTSAYLREIKISVTDFIEKLGVEKLENINIESRYPSNRVEKVKVNNNYYTGIEFRKLLNLRSVDFDIENNEDEITIKTRGYGHGVGMSQFGANGMANEGYNYKEILEYYYKNIKISVYKN